MPLINRHFNVIDLVFDGEDLWRMLIFFMKENDEISDKIQKNS